MFINYNINNNFTYFEIYHHILSFFACSVCEQTTKATKKSFNNNQLHSIENGLDCRRGDNLKV